jgi:hypothetical protein
MLSLQEDPPKGARIAMPPPACQTPQARQAPEPNAPGQLGEGKQAKARPSFLKKKKQKTSD